MALLAADSGEDCNHDMRYVETDGRIDRNAPYLGLLWCPSGVLS